MNPILVHYLHCRRAWPFSIRCLLFATGAALLLAGSLGVSDLARECNAGARLSSAD